MSSSVVSSVELSRILVIDDNPAIHADFRKVLEGDTEVDPLLDLSTELFGEQPTSTQFKPAFEIDTAQQGQAGFEKVKHAIEDGQPFAMAFVDMRMPPGWDGLETIENLWKVDPELQVVICTAYADYSWSEVVERLGSNDRWLVLKKPFDNAEVCQIASALTKKRQLSDQLRAQLGKLERRLDEGTLALQEREQRLRNILDTAPDGIITFDECGVIESVNPAACNLFGFEAGRVIGKSIGSLLSGSPETGQCEVRDIFALNENALASSVEVESIRTDGGIFPAQWTVGSASNDNCQFYTAIVRDLSEHKQLQCNLAQAQKLESVGQLAAGIAHEINTPTQYIGDNIRFLRDAFFDIKKVLERLQLLCSACQEGNSYPDLVNDALQASTACDIEFVLGEVPDTIDQTLEGIARVASIVQAMKEFSHPGDDEKSLVDIHASLQTSITVSRNEWKYVAEVRRDFATDMPLVPCLVGRLNQVFLNLIVNAAHAIEAAGAGAENEKGTISISTSHTDQWAIIEISDTGTGIPPEIRNRIFDPFFTTKGVGKGTGQGLAIARSVVVDKHGGTIDVISEPQQGTTFVIRLPLANPNSQLDELEAK